MTTTTPLKRSVQIKVTLTPELHERLREVAAQLGQAPATVASMAIGQYVAQMQRNLGAVDTATSALMSQIGPEIRGLLTTAAEAAGPLTLREPQQMKLTDAPVENLGLPSSRPKVIGSARQPLSAPKRRK